MSLTQPRKWLIAYDVRDPRRLKRVHTLLTKTAVPVQYSVFTVAGSTLAMRQLAAAVGDRIDARVDDVRFYPIPDKPQIHYIGPTMLPDGILVLDARTNLDALLGRTQHPRTGTAGVAIQIAPMSVSPPRKLPP